MYQVFNKGFSKGGAKGGPSGYPNKGYNDPTKGQKGKGFHKGSGKRGADNHLAKGSAKGSVDPDHCTYHYPTTGQYQQDYPTYQGYPAINREYEGSYYPIPGQKGKGSVSKGQKGKGKKGPTAEPTYTAEEFFSLLAAHGIFFTQPRERASTAASESDLRVQLT